MNYEEMKALADSIYDDTIKDDLFSSLINLAKDNVEDNGGVDWQILINIDTSQSASSGDTYLTMKALPSDFRRPIDNIWINGLEYLPIPFERRESFKNSSRRYYINYKDSQFAILGAPSVTQSIILPYIVTTDEIDDSNDWGFPDRFHKLLPIMVVGMVMNGVDADDIYRGIAPEWAKVAGIIENNILSWNTRLALHALDYSAAEFIGDQTISKGEDFLLD